MWFNVLWNAFTSVSKENFYLKCVCSTCTEGLAFIYVDGVPRSKLQINNEYQTRQLQLSGSIIVTH